MREANKFYEKFKISSLLILGQEKLGQIRGSKTFFR